MENTNTNNASSSQVDYFDINVNGLLRQRGQSPRFFYERRCEYFDRNVTGLLRKRGQPPRFFINGGNTSRANALVQALESVMLESFVSRDQYVAEARCEYQMTDDSFAEVRKDIFKLRMMMIFTLFVIVLMAGSMAITHYLK